MRSNSLTPSFSVILASIPSLMALILPPSPNSNTQSNTANIQSFVVTQEYSFGAQGVWVEHRQPANCTAAPAKPTLMDISPAVCTEQCQPGSFQPPQEEHCNKIINSLLTNSTGSLQADPENWIYVYYKTCVAVLENPNKDSVKLQYNWAMLGKIVEGLNNRCLLSDNPKSIGGACLFHEYQNVKFSNVQVTLQRFDEFEEDDEEVPMPTMRDADIVP